MLLLTGEETSSPLSDEGCGDLGRADPELGRRLMEVNARACFFYL